MGRRCPPPQRGDNVPRHRQVGFVTPTDRSQHDASPSAAVASPSGDESRASAAPSSSSVAGADEGNAASSSRSRSVPASELTTVSLLNAASLAEREKSNKGGSAMEVKDQAMSSKKKKGKASKAERQRALQETQRAAEAVAKGVLVLTALLLAEVNKASGTVTSVNAKSAKAVKPPQKVDAKSAKFAHMEYDDQSSMGKAKRRAVVKQTEGRNRVELFGHLPQCEHGSQLPDFEAKFFQRYPVHPAVYKVGLQYLSGDISGGNHRCIAMLQAFQEAIKHYTVPPEKTLVTDLTAKINRYVSFLVECRPLSISMGNAIRFFKSRIAKLPLELSELDSKTSIQSDIELFINKRIILADKEIVKHAVTKIEDGDVVLTYGLSSAVEMILLNARELGKQFRVVVVDSRPRFRGKLLLRRLVEKGLNCTYTHINAVSYIMHEVTKVFLGASSVLSNGTVYSGAGTACIAMAAHAVNVTVIVCCEAYKFHRRALLNSICSNELGDPNVISKVLGREDVNHLDAWATTENLQLLNLIYDVTPSDYVSMIVTDYGMVPPTSAPVIVREYNREQV